MAFYPLQLHKIFQSIKKSSRQIFDAQVARLFLYKFFFFVKVLSRRDITYYKFSKIESFPSFLRLICEEMFISVWINEFLLDYYASYGCVFFHFLFSFLSKNYLFPRTLIMEFFIYLKRINTIIFIKKETELKIFSLFFSALSFRLDGWWALQKPFKLFLTQIKSSLNIVALRPFSWGKKW